MNRSPLSSLRIVVVLISILFSRPLYAQTGALSGTITDRERGEPLPGVNILLVGTVLGTSTDRAGDFFLDGIPVGSYDIRISMIGYRQEIKQVDIRPNRTTNLTVSLEPTIINTPEIVVTANKRRQRLQDTPNSVGVMTRKDIQQRNEIYMDQALQYSSGVNFTGSQINIRGSSGYNYGAGSRVLFLVDGVPVMPGDSGDIKWDLIPTTQVERIEIIKGAGSALYGSSAMGGVINVITKQTSLKPVTHIRFSAGLYDEPAYPEWTWTDRMLHFDDVDIDHSRPLGKTSSLFVALGRHQSTGYEQNGHYQRLNGSVKLITRPTTQSKLSLFSTFEGGERGASLLWRDQNRALQVPPQAIGDDVKSNKFTLNSFYQTTVGDHLGINTRLSYFRNYWKNIFHDNISASTAQRYGLELQGDLQWSEHNSLVFGTEETLDLVESDLVGNHNQYILSAYLQNEGRVGDVAITAGARFDYHHLEDGFTDSKWSPKLGVVWHIHPALRVRASSGRGFRAPSLSERYSDSIYSGLRLVPNPDLTSETAWSHEIGTLLTLGPALYLDLALFRSEYWDLIEPQPDANQTIQFINLTRARITGFECHLTSSMFQNRIRLQAGYTGMNPRDLSSDAPLAYRPKHLATLSVTWAPGPFRAGINGRYVAALDRQAVKLYPDDDRVAQKVLDIWTSTHMGHVEIKLAVKNALNHNHTSVERSLLPIRHFVVTLSSTF
jgi:iron complex outermembrane receptor protein